MQIDDDIRFMRAAIAIGLKGQGRTAENPSVGAIIVTKNQNGQEYIVAAARTADGGRPHAEVQALAEAGDKAKGATLYVTLEPCAHTGKTGPCTQAVIEAGIKRVVIGIKDPDIRTRGKGIKWLKSTGMDVTVGICENEVSYALAGFILKVTEKRPFITAKMALTSNNIIAHKDGSPLRITSSDTNRFTHLLRATHNGIAVGYNTYMKDRPKLNVRLEGVSNRNPKQFVFTNAEPIIKFPDHVQAIYLNTDYAQSWQAALSNIIDADVTRLFIESGAKLFHTLVQDQIPDRVILYQSDSDGPIDGMTGLSKQDGFSFDNLPGYIITKVLNYKQDVAHIFHRKTNDASISYELNSNLPEEF